jgi:hypothetical protein
MPTSKKNPKMDSYFQPKPHFAGSHGCLKEVNCVYANGWMLISPPMVMINTETFILEDGTKVHSNVPFTFYKPSQGDLSTPPASMQIFSQAKVVAMLKKQTVTELVCTRSGFEQVQLPILQ